MKYLDVLNREYHIKLWSNLKSYYKWRGSYILGYSLPVAVNVISVESKATFRKELREYFGLI